ncbi:acyltransferase family protein [Nostoc sp.]|uniref:acyltransferase family protein n=1 Tax=Nostoc sp. TaxID=1180 RepID=UPI002FF6789F
MPKITHIHALDGLRGIAALMVMFFHFNWQSFNFSLINKVAVFGQTGVDLFFVLSGFLITRILIFTKENHSNNFFYNFYIRRSLRIFPLYYGFLILVYFVLPLFKIDNTPPLSNQLWYYLYLQNIPATFTDLNLQSSGPGHFWSLAVEEHFYLFWPLLVYFLPSKRLLWASLGIILLALVIRIILLTHNIGVFYFTLCRFDALAMGSLLAYLEYKNDLSIYRKYFVNIGIFSLVLLLITWRFTGGQGLDFIEMLKFTMIALFYLCLVGYLSIEKHQNLIPKIVSNPLLVFTGKISYGLYVFHPLIFGIIGNQNQNFYVCIVTSLFLTYLIAYLSYELYEKNFIKMKRYFEDSKNLTIPKSNEP